MAATEAALDSPLKGCEPNAASVLNGWRTFHTLDTTALLLGTGSRRRAEGSQRQ